MIQAGNLHALDHHPGLLGRRAPYYQLARTKAGASHAWQVLHHFQGVALGARNLARLLGADAGFHRLLLDAGGAHHDFFVDVVLFLFHVVLHGALLARPNGFVGQHSDQVRVANLNLVRGRRQVGEREGAGRIGFGGQVQILDPHGHVGQRLFLETIQDHTLEVHLRSQRHHLGHDGEVVAVRDLDGDGLSFRLGRSEDELSGRCHGGAVEVGATAFQNLDAAHLAIVSHFDGEQHPRGDPGVVLVLGVLGRNEMNQAGWLGDCDWLIGARVPWVHREPGAHESGHKGKAKMQSIPQLKTTGQDIGPSRDGLATGHGWPKAPLLDRGHCGSIQLR